MVAPVVVTPWPRSTQTGAAPIAASISAASSGRRMSTARGYTGIPASAMRIAGMLYEPMTGRNVRPARSAMITEGACAWATAWTSSRRRSTSA